MNILIRMAFDGAAYHGFQVQKNAPSVCAAVQDAMQAVFGERPDVKGCSRTDAGVHARDFCLSFHQTTDIPMEKLPLALNGHLPRDIRVFKARQVPEEFHARYSAAGKQYRYVILNSAVDDPFEEGYYYRVPQPIDEAAMQRAGQALWGRHDFAAFASAGGSAQDSVRTVSQLKVERRGRWVMLSIAADGFLYNMVRIIAGTLLAVGEGRLAEAEVAKILKGRRRAAAGDTLPARGLCLARVDYPEEALRMPND